MSAARAVAAGLATVACLAGVALAGAPLSIQIMTVQASESGPSDARLRPLRARLRRAVGYGAYRLVHEETRDVAWRCHTTFALPEDRTLQLLPKGMEAQTVTLQVRLLDGRKRLLDTNVRLRNGGTMVFGVGQDARAGDQATLILLRATR